MKESELEKAILEVLQRAETSWDGFVDVEKVAKELVALGFPKKKKEPPPILADDPPSEMFEDAFRDDHGTVSASCEFCGRMLFGAELETSGDEGEWEETMKGVETDPDKWVQLEGDMVSLATIGGMQTVLGCPCNVLKKYENFIWNEREKIAAYYEARLKAAKRALSSLEDVSKTASSVSEPGMEPELF